MELFRSMIEDADGKPKVGPAATMLGVRAGSKVPPADVIAELNSDLVGPGYGLSVAPNDPLNLPIFRRPAVIGGGTGKFPVWFLNGDELPPELEFCFDRPPTHGLIQPVGLMRLQDFQYALVMTRELWTNYNC